MTINHFEPLFENYMNQLCDENPDPSHDILHVKRVVALAKNLSAQEKANLWISVPAAWLHDCIYISKADHRRNQASLLSADKAMQLLKDWKYPEEFLPSIHHAILAHSFSANIPTQSTEAKVVQDADRLDAMGATGIFRCFAFSGLARRPLHSAVDPFCKDRKPDDRASALDHFFTKLLHLQDKLNTDSAKQEGQTRLKTIQVFLRSLEDELAG